MKALQFQALGKADLVEMEPPRIRDDELLIQTGAATICTSDLNDIRENPFGIELPVVLGHEGAGTVAAMGRQVAGFRVGDRVATHPVHPCGRCANCTRGWGHLCVAMEHLGINRPGTFAGYYAVRADRARRIPDDVPFTTAALAEPVCVCLEALAQARLDEGGKLLIVGDGPFGVLIARLALELPKAHQPGTRSLRASSVPHVPHLGTVVVAGRHDFRLGYARGAARINVSKVTDPLAALRAEAGGAGYDAAILAVGSVQAAQESLALLRHKGRLVVFSAVAGKAPVDLFDVHVRELEIVGACNDQDRLDEAVDSLADPALALEELVTHRLPIEAHAHAFDLAAHGSEEALKVAFTFEESR
jgi:threonine dehydrogenase-like Zn-dependent dehydrogenase